MYSGCATGGQLALGDRYLSTELVCMRMSGLAYIVE